MLPFGSARSVAQGRPAWIDGFSGWAGPDGGVLYARVHKGEPVAKPKPNESSWKRLEETVNALEHHAFEHATVAVSGVAGVTFATSNDDGFIALELPAKLCPGPLRITLSLDEKGWQPATAEVVVQVWDDQPGFGIISDIDDTLTDAGVTHKAKLIKNTFFVSEYELKIFANAPQVLSMLAGNDHPGGASRSGRALFYLSGSPWGLHERISDAFASNGLPPGAMILRSYSLKSLGPLQFKLPHLQRLFKAFRTDGG